MTTPQAQYIEQPEPEDFFDHLEKVTYDLESERISHGLTRGILMAMVDMLATAIRLQIHPSWNCNSDHPALHYAMDAYKKGTV